MNLDESRYRGENGDAGGGQGATTEAAWFAIGQTGNMTKKRKEKMKLVIMTLNFSPAQLLCPDLEKCVPRASAECLAVLRDAQAAYAVIVTDQLVDQCAQLSIPNIAVVVIITSK